MGLSRRAENLLARLRAGRFYPAYSERTPKCMQELIDAGLVATAGRPTLFIRCYVPAEGFTPFKPEKFK